MSHRTRPLFFGMLVVFAVAAATFGASVSQRNTENLRASTFNKRPLGLRGVYETLRRMEVPVRRWQRPYGELPDDAGVLIMANPMRPISEREWQQALRPWVMAGRTLIVAGDRGNPLRLWWSGDDAMADELRYSVSPTGAHRDGGETTEAAPDFAQVMDRYTGIATERVAAYAVFDAPLTPAGAPLELEPFLPLYCFTPQAAPLYVGEEGPYAWHIPVQRGRVIVTATSHWLTNAGAPEGRNFALLLRLLDAFGAGRAVLFDERAQGFPQGDVSLGSLIRQPAWAVALVQLLLLGAWYGASGGRRFGPVIPLIRSVPRSTMEYVDAMANLYRRAGLQRSALAAHWQSFRVDVAHRYGVEPGAPLGAVRERLLAAVRDLDETELDAALAIVREHAYGTGRVNDRDLVRAARTIANLRRRVL